MVGDETSNSWLCGVCTFVIHCSPFVVGFVVQITAHLVRIGMGSFKGNLSSSPAIADRMILVDAIVPERRMVYRDHV